MVTVLVTSGCTSLIYTCMGLIASCVFSTVLCLSLLCSQLNAAASVDCLLILVQLYLV